MEFLTFVNASDSSYRTSFRKKRCISEHSSDIKIGLYAIMANYIKFFCDQFS